jgi:hypothetical protein
MPQTRKISLGRKVLPFHLLVKGKINGTPLTIIGNGSVPETGVYKGELKFSALPKNFHPCAVATYIISICCYRHAAMRNGGLNILSMGATGYFTRRELTFGGKKDERIVIEGNLSGDPRKGLNFTATINGQAKLPADLAGNSIYIKRIDPEEGGRKLVGRGEGSLFRKGGLEFPVKIKTVHNLKGPSLKRPLLKTQFRIVTESGELIGKTYKTIVHSILDGENTMARLAKM